MDQIPVECFDDLLRAFYKQDGMDRVYEITVETERLKELKQLRIKHAFDDSSSIFQEIYNNQEKYLVLIKSELKERYGI